MSDGPKKTDRETSDPISIGRIPLKQVRVARSPTPAPRSANPMNRLVPYLDLFARLDDAELSRLAGVETTVTAALRDQVDAIGNALSSYVDLLARLDDEELVRLTNAAPKTIRFWRLCQPRVTQALTDEPEPDAMTTRSAASRAPTAPMPAVPRPIGSSSSDEGSAADSYPGGDARREEMEDTGSFPISRPTPDVSQYMRFSGDPFPGFDDSRDSRDPSSARPASAGYAVDEDDPLRGL